MVLWCMNYTVMILFFVFITINSTMYYINTMHIILTRSDYPFGDNFRSIHFVTIEGVL